jgi:hypothetical protein
MNPSTTFTKLMFQAFKDVAGTMPTLFLSGFFGKNPQELQISNNLKVEIDIQRYDEQIAVDVLRGGDGNSNNLGVYTTKEYLPPLFDEYQPVTAQQVSKRFAGDPQTAERARKEKMIQLIVEGQLELAKKIWRAIEKQAADCLFNGIVSLTNGDNIDFYRLATHNITPGTAWGAGGDPITDLALACQVNRIDGKVTSNIAIFSNSSWDDFISNANVIAYLDNRRIEPGNFTPSFDRQGSVFQGVIWVGSYRLECYTYDQYYTASGSATGYIPDGQVSVFASNARLDKAFGGTEVLSYDEDLYNSLGIPGVPLIQAGEMIPYAHSKGPKTLVSGVQSAPLLMPTQIDAITNINT